MRQIYNGLPWIRSSAAPEIVELFAKYGAPVFFKKGSIIISKGRYRDTLSLVRNGLVERAICNDTLNKHKAVALLPPGRLLGMTHFMSRRENNVLVRAMRDTMLTELPFEIIEKRMAADKHFTAVVLRQFSTDWESDLEGLSTLVFFRPEYNLICLFYVLAKGYNTDTSQEWVKLPLNLSYQEMAIVIYTTRVTVIRIINNWKAAGKYRTEESARYFHQSLLEELVDWKK